MNFLAILKDSFREAIDSKVLYVMLGVSLLVILLVGSISYRPMPAAEAFPAMVQDFNDRNPFEHHRQRKGLSFGSGAVSDLRQIDQAAQPFRGEYQFTFEGRWHANDHGFAPQIAIDNPEIAEAPKNDADPEKADDPMELTPAIAEAFVKKQFELRGLEVLSIKLLADKATPTSQSFDISVRGKGDGRSWLHKCAILFGAIDFPIPGTLGGIVYYIENKLINGVGAWIALLVSIIITAFFIPNMLHKGTIDLLLAKPIGRVPLLLYKYVGGLSFMFVNSAVAVGGMWLVLGVRSGIWEPAFLLSIFVLTFYFAVLYAVSALLGVLTRSAVIAILLSCLTWFVFVIIAYTNSFCETAKKVPAMPQPPTWLSTTAHVVHAVTPRTTDLENMIQQLLSRSLLSDAQIHRDGLDVAPEYTWSESLGVSSLFIAVMLALACWRFWVKDY